MRRPVKRTFKLAPDPKYKSAQIGQFVNYVMKKGKKNVAKKIVYGAFDQMAATLNLQNIPEAFDTIMRNIGPTVEVRSRRIGGATYQVPREVRPERRQSLAMRWILEAARGKKGSEMSKRLATELIAAYKNEGEATKKRDNVHKMAEANRAFAHFAW